MKSRSACCDSLKASHENYFVLTLLVPGVAGAQSAGTFTATGNTITPRSFGHTATLLSNGKVLIAGGSGYVSANTYEYSVSSAELYDPSTGAFSATGDMTTARSSHAATLLPTGKVLIAGGLTFDTNANGTSVVTSAELYDPFTGIFTPTGNMAASQTGAALLTNGKVLMTSYLRFRAPRSTIRRS
jgi:hypothetical protein